MIVHHRVKSWPEFFQPVLDGSKPFELRHNDRGYQVGHVLWLQEWEPNSQSYTGRETMRKITYVMEGLGSVGTIAPVKGLALGYAILGLAPFGDPEHHEDGQEG